MAAFQLMRRIFGNAAPGERRQSSRSDAPRGMHVLVVDDEEDMRLVMRVGLNLANEDLVVVGEAADGESALALAREHVPDLIFLDIVMPGMNGFAVLRALRHEMATQEIPIVMISGNLQATEQFYVQRFGADDFMKKPFGRGEVFARIKHLTAKGRLHTRERAPTVLADDPALTPAEHAAIPDIAMPDAEHLPPADET